MKLDKVLTIRQQSKKNAADALGEAQRSLAQVQAQVTQISELSEEYAQGVAQASSGYELRQRALFFSQLVKTRQIQQQLADELTHRLEQCQMQFAQRRVEEKLLEDLITKRELHHNYKLRKKLARTQVSRSATKL